MSRHPSRAVTAPRSWTSLAVLCVVTMVLTMAQLVTAPAASASTLWRATLIDGPAGTGMLPTDFDGTWAVGSRADTAYAYNLDTGELIDLGTLGGSQSGAEAVNGNRIIGWSFTDVGYKEPFLYDLTTRTMRSLRPELGFGARVTGISGSTVIGSTGDAGFAYDLDTGDKRTIPALPWRGVAYPSAIDGQVVVGTSRDQYLVGPFQQPHAFSYNLTTGTLRDLGTLPWDARSTANDVSGTTIVGTSYQGEITARIGAFVVDADQGEPVPVPGTTPENRTWGEGVSPKWLIGNTNRGAFATDRATSARVNLPAPSGTTRPRAVAVAGDTIIGRAYSDQGTYYGVIWRAWPFLDVTPETTGFTQEITWLKNEGITTGYPNGNFGPKDRISREAMAAFLYRSAGEPKVTSNPDFNDVNASSKFAKEIAWLQDEGITTGYPNGNFGPKDRISREAMAAFLYRAQDLLHGIS